MLLESVETTPGQQRLVGGVLKATRQPVLVLVGAQRLGALLSCDWVITHAGLIPGDYPLRDGTTVRIPQSLCGDAHRASRGVTLEVKRDESQEQGKR